MVENFRIKGVTFVGHGGPGSLGGSQAGTDAITIRSISNTTPQRKFLHVLAQGLRSSPGSEVRIRMCKVGGDPMFLNHLVKILGVRIWSTDEDYFIIPLGVNYYTDPTPPPPPPRTWFPAFPSR